ncbi:MAG: pro-sigmaK processing inhibitor BofA family protein [Defluviitaleaceae bacterium]|nr:pro-sigmaK processing inhibitor BofA family protein [Defluviitaleaceae bacterium]
MDSTNLIMWLIAACLVFAAVMIFAKPIKTIACIFIQAVLGSALMYIVNFVLAPFAIFVGVNALTAFIVGVLGLPGLFTLYILQVFL